MSETWVLLMPREVEILARPIDAEGEHGDLLRGIVKKIDVRGEVTLTGAEVLRLKSAGGNYRLGYGRQVAALLAALERHR